MIALSNRLIAYATINKDKSADFVKHDNASGPLMVKYMKYQKVSSLRITHFLPRMGDQPQFTVKGQIRQYDPKHPNAVAEDFKIPLDFPPKTGNLRGFERKIPWFSSKKCR